MYINTQRTHIRNNNSTDMQTATITSRKEPTNSARLVIVVAVLYDAVFITMIAMQRFTLTHFTYWGMAVCATGFTAWAAAIVHDMRTTARVFSPTHNTNAFLTPLQRHTTEALTVAIVYPVMLCIQVLISVIITVLPLMDDEMLPRQVKPKDMGKANLGNLVLHYIPLFAVFISFTARLPTSATLVSNLHANLVAVLGWDKPDTASWLPYIGIAPAFGAVLPLLLLATYSSYNDFTVEYEVNASRWIVSCIAYATIVCVLVVYLWFLHIHVRSE